MSDRTCSVEGCDRKHTARGWCLMHWKRWYRHGDPLATPTVGRSDIGYAASHYRVRSARGPASGHLCVDCGQPAQDWSYRHGSATALVQAGGADAAMPYSLDPADYDPRCRPCHAIYDRRS